MAKLTAKHYVIITIAFILFMAFLCLYYVGGETIRLALKCIAIGFMTGSILTLIFIGKEK